jgi:hypothetical protein
MLALAPLVTIIDKLGIISTVKDKLLQHPDPAADKLVVVLEEVSKVFQALDSELSRYLSIAFDDDPVRHMHERESLLKLEGGQIKSRVDEARGHCDKIENIYSRYLERWFACAVSPGEAKQLEELFGLLGTWDGGIIDILGEHSKWLTAEASAVLDLVDAGSYVEANTRIRAARKALLPSRRRLSDSMSELRKLQNEFIDIAGIV